MAQSMTLQIDSPFYERLKALANSQGTTIEDFSKALLEKALKQDWEEFWTKTDLIQGKTKGKRLPDSADFIREDRKR